ncbi:MAG TPA: TonB-dependent receptor, partial [Opitutaceae bacterium]
QILPTEDYFQYAGTSSQNGFANAVGTIPRWRTYSTLDWKMHGVDFLAGFTFVPTVEDVGSGGFGAAAPIKVPSYQQWDFSVGYNFNALKVNHWLDGLSVRLGVNNAFNYLPPVSPGGVYDTNTDLATYDGAVGRLFFGELRYKF